MPTSVSSMLSLLATAVCQYTSREAFMSTLQQQAASGQSWCNLWLSMQQHAGGAAVKGFWGAWPTTWVVGGHTLCGIQCAWGCERLGGLGLFLIYNHWLCAPSVAWPKNIC